MMVLLKWIIETEGTDSLIPILFPEKGLKDKVIIEDFLISDANANDAIFKYKPE